MGNKVPSTIRLDEHDDNTVNLLADIAGHAKGAILRELVKVGLGSLNNKHSSGSLNVGSINIGSININTMNVNSHHQQCPDDDPLIIDIPMNDK